MSCDINFRETESLIARHFNCSFRSFRSLEPLKTLMVEKEEQHSISQREKLGLPEISRRPPLYPNPRKTWIRGKFLNDLDNMLIRHDNT